MKCPLSVPGGDSVLHAHVAQTGSFNISRHVRSCDACSRWVDAQSAVWKALDRWEAPPVSPDFDRKLLARIAEPEPWWVRANRLFSGYLTRPVLPLSLAALLLAVAAAFLNVTPHAQPVGGAQSERIQPVTARDAEQLDKTVEDLQLLQQLDAKEEASGDPSPI